MTELLELVAFGKEVQKDEFCEDEYFEEDPGWTPVIDGISGKGDAKVLADNLEAGGEEKPELPKRKGGLWDLDECDETTFPWQAHHLVPEKQLPKHDVTFYLSVNSDFEHDEYVLHWDTDYDTNAYENGRFLPFASTTYQWAKAGKSAKKKKDICFKMMKQTQRQLHQGPHSRKDYLGDEDPDVESRGYKEVVDRLLDIVYFGVSDHVDICEVCKSDGPDGKKYIQPLEATVRHVHRASEILENLIIADEIHVSKRAAIFYDEVGY